jgi:UPF0755 protein
MKFPKWLNPTGKKIALSKKVIAIQLSTIVALLFIAALYTYYTLSPAVHAEGIQKEIEIPERTGAWEVAQLLQDEGFIRSKIAFLGYLYLNGKGDNIIPGLYVLTTTDSLPDVINTITNPEDNSRKEFTLLIHEGTTLRGIADLFQERGMFSPEMFWQVSGTPAVDFRLLKQPLPDVEAFAAQFPFLADKPVKAGLEGYLFPDSYRFYEDASPHEVVEKMLQNFNSKLSETGIFEEIQRQGKSVYEVLTLASLLEREAATYNDKQIIAGIILKRIKTGMAIQIDASLMYFTGKGSALLTQSDLAADDPYNTYKYTGLPLGPIANPGMDSIKAALFPKQTVYFFYLSDSAGTIHYSATGEEHARKKAIYID